MRGDDESKALWQSLSLRLTTIDKEITENNNIITKLQSHFYVSDAFTLDEELQIDDLPNVGTLEPLPEESKKNVYVGYVKSSNPYYELFKENTATSYYSGHIDIKDADLQSLEFLLPLIGGKVVGFYEIEAVTFKKLRRIRPLKEGENGNELRIVFSLGTFIPLSNGPISYNNRLHNNETYSYDEIMQKIEQL